MSNDSLSMRMYFFVTRHAQGWHVSVEKEPPVSFVSRESALDAAMTGAKKIWEDFRQSTGVQVEDPTGAHRVMRTFG